MTAGEATNKQSGKLGNYESITEVVSFLRIDTDPVQAASRPSVLYV